jgi:hypothetical protein
MQDKREEYRVRIHRTGQLRRGSDVAPCELIELTETGVLVQSDLHVTIGEAVDLDFDLTPDCPIHCTILVTHAALPHFGGLISSISPEHQQHVARFIKQLIEINLTGF